MPMLKGMVLYLQNKLHSVNNRGQLLIVLCINGAPATGVFTIPGSVSWSKCSVLWGFFSFGLFFKTVFLCVTALVVLELIL